MTAAFPQGLKRPDLVASDLDGTLLPPDLVFAPTVRPAIEALQAAGVVFAICTGRMFRSVRQVARGLGLDEGLVVCYQGAMVADLASGERLLHRPLRAEVAAEVARVARDLGRHLNAFVDDELYVDELDEWARRYAEYAGVEVRQVDDLEAFVAECPPTKLVLMSTPEDVAGLLPGLRQRWSGRLLVTTSQPSYLEFVDAAAGKSAALEWLCGRLGLRAGRTVACGDGLNDEDMIRWAAVGVAVAEGAPAVRAAADIVVPRAGLPELLRELAAAPVD